MAICSGSGPFSVSDPCIRDAWSSLLPAAFVLVLCISYVPLPAALSKITNAIKSPFTTFLPVAEAEALLEEDAPPGKEDEKAHSPIWFTLALSWTALLETVAWMAVGCYELIAGSEGVEGGWNAWKAIIVAFSWLYASIRPVVRPTATPPYDLFILYLMHLSTGTLQLGGLLFDSDVYGVPLPGKVVIGAHIVNLVAVLGLLLIVLSRPLAIPSSRVSKEDIGKSVSPEEYTSLWGWISFHWIRPLIKRGTYATLNEPDVWGLSATFQTRPVFLKFNSTHRPSLLRRLLAANSLDIILDVTLTFVSVVFNYAGPFFLKRILDALSLDPPSREKRAEAYIFAGLAFLCTLLKAQADLHHLWFSRRAATRMRSELMAAIYAKALTRTDFSGVVRADAPGADNAAAAAPGAGTKKGAGDGAKKGTGDGAKKGTGDVADPKAGADVGKIVNLMSGDANRVAMTAAAIYMLYSAPFEIIIASTFLYQLIGWPAFAGFVFVLLGWPLNSYIARRSIGIQKSVLAARDKRMGVLNELIGAVKFIKFFAWEDRWIKRAMDAREVEIGWMVKARINAVFFQVLWSSGSILVSVISFFVYVYQGNELTVGIAFTSIALFNMIRMPLTVVPAYIVATLQTKVALDRIEAFLNEDEVSAQVSTLKASSAGPDAPRVDGLGLRNASFRWNAVPEPPAKDKKAGKNKKSTVADDDVLPDSASAVADTDHRFELRDISLMLPEGELTVVTGPTASGKSALLLALLGEMTLLPGGEIIMHKDSTRVDEHGLVHCISYAAQLPWLQHQSIKENILFGSPFDEARYEEVVECCALGPDLKILEDGDETEIGARGVSLSGGQKARVALARAVYARTKYVLLDDPLSAVDSHTSRFLYERLFLGPLMQHRTVVLVTHHVELVLPGAYYVVRMLDGRIDTQGTVKDLRARGVLEAITQDAAVLVDEKTERPAAAAPNPGEEPLDAAPEKKAKAPRKLVEDEERETGKVKWAIYKTYLLASSYWTWLIIGTLIVLSQLIGVTEKYWIMTWGEAYGNNTSASTYIFSSFVAGEKEVLMTDTGVSHHYYTHVKAAVTSWDLHAYLPSVRERPLFYVGVYAAIGGLSVLVSISSTITQYVGGIRASRILFKRILVSVVHATMRWHDVTPTGRMLNRFSKDIETVDSSLAGSLQSVNASLATFFSSIIVVAVVFPVFVIPAAILGYFYYSLALGYLNTGRDLRRMESTSRSPIFSGFGEMLEGIVTVRAFSAERRFLNGLYKKVDLTTQMWYSFWMTNRWLLLHFDALGASAVLITTLLALFGYVSGGLAGFVITSAMTFTSNIYWACRFWTQLELDLNSVERVVEYLDLPQEPPAVIESNRPPAHWPSGSANSSLVVVEDLVVKYAPDLPAVLHGVSFSLKAGERVGLLGRTGSGKSTLAMSILRFIDPAGGRIIIDGIDITKIGVHDLRSRLTFIPQDATLFSGTLRDNLDPFGDYTDTECLDVLHRVHMLTENSYQSQKSSRDPSRAPSIQGDGREETAASSTAGSPSGTEIDGKTTVSLDSQVSAAGTNFSQGQRQLIAMARALLRQSSIIVLDEATSSIDFATDAKIQTTIREEFNNSLLLTVAHRLRTVIDYDRLIVLDKGLVAELDTPYNLIQKEGGIFRTMCMKSGTFAELEDAAKAAAQDKRGSF